MLPPPSASRTVFLPPIMSLFFVSIRRANALYSSSRGFFFPLQGGLIPCTPLQSAIEIPFLWILLFFSFCSWAERLFSCLKVAPPVRCRIYLLHTPLWFFFFLFFQFQFPGFPGFNPLWRSSFPLVSPCFLDLRPGRCFLQPFFKSLLIKTLSALLLRFPWPF